MTTDWVFLRGLIRQHRHWEDFPARFNAAFPGARIHLPDLPGNGDLWDQPSPLRVQAMVDSVRAQLQRRGLSGPVNLLAISLGGMVAIDWMQRFPGEIAAAVVINSSMRSMGRLTDRLRPGNVPALLRHLLLDRSPLGREAMILAFSSNLRSDTAQLAQRWAAYAETHPTRMANALRQLIAASRYAGPPQRPHDRVLVLQSAQDRLVHPGCSQRMAAQWNWPLRTHPTAGHDLPLDDGDWVIAQVRHWLASSSDCS